MPGPDPEVRVARSSRIGYIRVRADSLRGHHLSQPRRFLGDAIESVRRQTFEDLEIIRRRRWFLGPDTGNRRKPSGHPVHPSGPSRPVRRAQHRLASQPARRGPDTPPDASTRRRRPATLPGISQTYHADWGAHRRWNLTALSTRTLRIGVSPRRMSRWIPAGTCSPRREEMDHHDPDQVPILVRAVKPAPGN